MKILEEFSFDKKFHYENGFYLTSTIDRLGKMLAHYELYKLIIDLPGHIVECGVFKGNSLIRLATFRNLYESHFSRKIIGFDIFGEFPKTEFKDDKKFRDEFIQEAGKNSISENELEKIFQQKGIENFELIKGDINITVPKYVKENPQLKIALLHIDTDVYEPAVTILEHMYDRIARGGIIMFDDYGTFPGETKAVDEFFQNKNIIIKKLPISHIPSYIIKRN